MTTLERQGYGQVTDGYQVTLLGWADDTWITTRKTHDKTMLADRRESVSTGAGFELCVPRCTWTLLQQWCGQDAPGLRAVQEAHPNLSAMGAIATVQCLRVACTLVQCDGGQIHVVWRLC